MNAVILAGGRGSRLGTLTDERPKALLPVAGRPLLDHLLRWLEEEGVRDVLVVTGYLAETFAPALEGLGFRRGDGEGEAFHREGLHVRLEDTGPDTGSAQRLRKVAPLVQDTFLLLYCDGLADVSLREMIAYHRDHGRDATVLAVHPPSPFGVLDLDGSAVRGFREKPILGDQWINGGVFVVEPRVLASIRRDAQGFEREVLEAAACRGGLAAFRHEGFWRCLDTVADLEAMEAALARGGPA